MALQRSATSHLRPLPTRSTIRAIPPMQRALDHAGHPAERHGIHRKALAFHDDERKLRSRQGPLCRP